MFRYIHRNPEMKMLELEYARKGASLFILYGRRRVGKTTLISEFIKHKMALYYLASEESELQNRRAFKEKTAEFINSILLKEAAVSNWSTIFKAIVDNIPYDRKSVIVIDEFPSLVKACPTFPFVFKRIWEDYFANLPVMMILCGSNIPAMEAQFMNCDSPLYGVQTAQLRMESIPFWYYALCFPEMDRDSLIREYAVTGGIPKYIGLFQECNTIYDAIEQHILRPSSALYEEPHFLLQQEVTEIGYYFSLLKAIAAGRSKLYTIANVLETHAERLTKYLKTLIDLGILEQVIPVMDDNPENSQRYLYRIRDNFIRFWFAYVYPNMSAIERGSIEVVMTKIRRDFSGRYISDIYGDICRERLWILNTQGTWDFSLAKVGRYWNKNMEIGIAALDSDGHNLILGEYIWQDKPAKIQMLNALEAKSKLAGWNLQVRRTHYVLFSAGGFSPELRDAAERRKDVLLIMI